MEDEERLEEPVVYEDLVDKRNDELMELLEGRNMKQLRERMNEMQEFDVAEFLFDREDAGNGLCLGSLRNVQLDLRLIGYPQAKHRTRFFTAAISGPRSPGREICLAFFAATASLNRLSSTLLSYSLSPRYFVFSMILSTLALPQSVIFSE